MTSSQMIIKKALTILTITLLTILILFLAKGFLEGNFQSIESMENYVKQFGIAAPLIFILIQILQVVIPILPGFIGCAAGAILFGSIGGFFCNYIGISLGSLAAFLLARKYGIGFVKKIISEEKYEKYAGWLDKKKQFTIVLFLTILLPLAPDDIFCYISGLTKMEFQKFAWIIILAKPWCILAYSFGFAALV